MNSKNPFFKNVEKYNQERIKKNKTQLIKNNEDNDKNE